MRHQNSVFHQPDLLRVYKSLSLICRLICYLLNCLILLRLFKYLLQTFPNLRGRLWPRAVERLVPASRSSLSKRSWQVIPTRCWSRPRGWRCSGPTPSRPSSSLHPGGTGTCSTVDHSFQWKVNQSTYSLSHNTYIMQHICIM